MTLVESLSVLSNCLRFSAEHVDTVRLNCTVLTNPDDAPTASRFRAASRSINASHARLETAVAALGANEIGDALERVSAVMTNYAPFLWDGFPYHPATLAIEPVANSLLGDTNVFESWDTHPLTDEERLSDCRLLLAKWPADLPTRLRVLRGQVDFEIDAASRPDTNSNANKSNVRHPRNPDVKDLCAKLAREHGKGKSDAEIARDFTGGNRDDANRLLQQARRFRHLWANDRHANN